MEEVEFREPGDSTRLKIWTRAPSCGVCSEALLDPCVFILVIVVFLFSSVSVVVGKLSTRDMLA